MNVILRERNSAVADSRFPTGGLDRSLISPAIGTEQPQQERSGAPKAGGLMAAQTEREKRRQDLDAAA
jgi:hypothetical protein